LKALGESDAAAYARAMAAVLPERRAAMLAAEFREAVADADPARHVHAAMRAADTDDPMRAAMAADFAVWLPGRMLTKVDRAAMAWSLETRAPFLDHGLVEWAARLPSAHRVSTDGGKRVLRAAMRPRLPAEILDGAKQGFSPPVSGWLRAERDNPLDRLAASKAWRESGVLDETIVDRMMTQHRSGARDFAADLWCVVMFDAFLRVAP